jgi:diguanylate cyclase (GGDEF)-like protein
MRSAAEERVATTKSFNDDATDRQLRLLIGLVVVLASLIAGAVAVAWQAAGRPGPQPSALTLFVLTAAVVVVYHVHVHVRIHNTWHGTTWSEVPVLVGLTLLPIPWVVACAGLGVAIHKSVTRVPLHRTVFGTAKELITATTAGLVFVVCGGVTEPNHLLANVGAAVVAFVAMSIVDDLVFIPVIAFASRTPMLRFVQQNWDIKLLGQVTRLVMVVVVIGIMAFGGTTVVLLVVPPMVLGLHLLHKHRLRTREERQSWQRLSQTIDKLNVVDLSTLLHAAVTRGAEIFSAEEVEIDLTGDEAGTNRIVRGDAEGVTADEPRSRPVPAERSVVMAELETHDGSYRVGELRLRFRTAVKLTEFEQYKLKTFASALCTAIRNAKAYAELARVSAENAYAAAHDPLTGLANRRKLYEQAGEIFDTRANDGILALLLIDLNHFKEVNDTLGHAAGDDVLCEVARRLQEAARPGDLVARLGGDEFAILMTKLPTPAMASHRAESMLTALDPGIEIDGMQLTVEAAGGIALAPGSGGVEELMRRADVAMYQAKRSGQRTANYMHARDTADVGRLMLGTDLRRAVDKQEFVVDYQPIVDLGSGEVVSAEALARWHHPQHGNLTPLQFLETVERSGQLAAFADAVLDQSLRALSTWREAGFDLPVAVNVSPRSLLDPQFPQAVLAQLQSHAVSPDRLVLELAETLTISQLEVVDRALGELHEAGVRLALDDFGTGVSSLSVLSRLPVHELKIDREFVLAVETSSEATAVIRSTVDLARSLHLTVVAEGVESEPQRQALFKMGCVAGQGHLFARPMRAGRFLAAMQRGSGGRPGVLAAALHETGSVVRMPRRRLPGHGRSSLPHLPA